jgi:hypothetical protein
MKRERRSEERRLSFSDDRRQKIFRAFGRRSFGCQKGETHTIRFYRMKVTTGR